MCSALRPRRGVWVTYVGVGAVAAIARVALLVARVDQPNWMAYTLEWALHPEIDLGHISPFGREHSATLFYISWSSILTLGSFVMATPVLLVGWLVQRLTVSRQLAAWYLMCGTALAIVRLAVLVWVEANFTATPWSRLWVLCPEALLLIDTRYEASFVLAALLGVGSFLIATPILFVGWLVDRRRQDQRP